MHFNVKIRRGIEILKFKVLTTAGKMMIYIGRLSCVKWCPKACKNHTNIAKISVYKLAGAHNCFALRLAEQQAVYHPLVYAWGFMNSIRNHHSLLQD